ncbi:MAG: sulfatase-like hydrolase/transferase [Planctomycetes bacterium]|nr:sulfatase-like hydrolase/transferase [Planctomycetota bacterium]
MTEVSNRLTLPPLGAAWLSLAAIHGALQLVAPRSVLGDPLLPGWARLTLLATEASALSVLVILMALSFRILLFAGDRVPSRLRPVVAGLRSVVVTAVLIGLAGSWVTFWLSGQFLDRQGILFASSNFSSVFGYAARIHPFLVYGLPCVLLAVSIVACEVLPRWVRSLPPAVERIAPRATIAGVGIVFAAAAAGEIGHRFATQKITDPSTGAVYSRDDLYRLRRERNAGPLTHLLSSTLGSKNALDDDPSAAPPKVLRRPIVSMEEYVSGIDRARLNRWNVVVILIDSLRADQLRATGGGRDVMPALEALAEEGRAFTDCVTPASHTDYACPAVFSSQHPLRARDVYRYPKDPPYPRLMMYDVLKALGWRTALFSSQNEEWGQMMNYMQTGGLEVVFHSKTAGVSEDATRDRPAFSGALDDSVTIGESMKWIDSAAGAPFFLYLNLQNSHLPYDVPADFPRRFSPRELDFKISVGWFPQEKAEIVKNVYADSLAYVDSQLERLFRRLKERGLWDRTLLVVSGDHGEAFYEHGSAAHANGVHEEVIRVPLVIRAPGLERSRDGRPAHLLDVTPGVFHLLGLPAHPAFQGEDLFALEPRADRVRFVMSDTPWKTQLGVIQSGFKLIRDGDTGGSVLYDLARDPGEKTDATEARPEIARRLRERLGAWRRSQLEYYANSLRQACEYPPFLQDP